MTAKNKILCAICSTVLTVTALCTNVTANRSNDNVKDSVTARESSFARQEAQYDVPAVVLGDTTAKPGEKVSVPIKVLSNNSLEIIDMAIEWSDEALAFDSVNIKDTIPNHSEYSESTHCSISCVSYEAIDDGDVAAIQFTVPKNAKSDTVYHLNITDISTFTLKNGDDIPESVAKYSGKITVVGDSVTTSSTYASDPAKTTTTTAVGGGNTIPTILGDANGDGVLNVRDAAYIAKFSAQGRTAELPMNADFNSDGKVNIRDAAAIAKHLVSK